MKYLVIIPDGIGDHPFETLGGKTPLEVARIPNLEYFTKIGKVGMVKTVPDKLDVSSHAALFSLMGYDPRRITTGPGALEAANLEVKLEDNEVAFRMNLVTEAQGLLADAAAGNIGTREAKALINFLNKKLSSDFVRFFPVRGYRHIAVIKDARGFQALSAACKAPETVVGKPVEANLPKGPGQDMIRKLMYDAKMLLEQHEINQVRVDLGENPANFVWLWGQGLMPKIQKFQERTQGLSGAMVSMSEYVKGFARLVGMTVMEMNSSAAYPDYDYELYAQAMEDLLQDKDFVCVHITVCEEASREGNLKQKILSLESLDHYLLGRAKAIYEATKDIRILVAPLVNIPCQAKMPVRESVPFILSGKNIMADEIERYNEASARVSHFKISEGWKILDALIDLKEG